MSSEKKFIPTAGMIEAAEALFFAMAQLSLIEPLVLNYQRLILREGQWRVKREYVNARMPDEVVLDPERAFLMEDKDLALYHELCLRAQAMTGLQVKVAGNCPLLEARSAVIDAQAQLTRHMAGITGHTPEQLLMLPLEKYRQYVDLSLRLLAPFVDPHKRYGIPKPIKA